MEESNSSFGFASTDKLYNTLAMTDTIKKMDVCWIVSARPHKATSLASLLKRLGFNIFQLSQRPKQYRHNERLATFSATFSWGNLFQRPKQYWKAEDAKTSYFMSTKKIQGYLLYYETVSTLLLLTTAITFSIYSRTASDSIAGGDSGELVAEGCSLGTSHPPGYPLYTIIVYLVTTLGKQWCPNLSPAYLVNMTSCVFGSISSGLISLVVFNLTNEDNSQRPAAWDQRHLSNISRCSAALSAGLMCSFSPLMWQYNTSAEVFALHNLFVTLIIYVMTIYSFQPNSTSIVALGSFLCGLALTNQHTSILLIVPVVIWVFCNSSLLAKPKLLLLSSISFVVGISLYALLPLLAINYPHAGSWGEVTTLSGFLHHLLRRDYGTLQLYSGDDAASEGMIARTCSWALDFVSHQLGPWSSLLLVPLLGFNSGVQIFGYTSKMSKTKMGKKQKRESHKAREKNDPSSSVWKIILFALVLYLGAFHSLSNLPLSNPLLYGIHQVSALVCSSFNVFSLRPGMC